MFANHREEPGDRTTYLEPKAAAEKKNQELQVGTSFDIPHVEISEVNIGMGCHFDIAKA
jgi:hypothetical protein